MTTINKTTNNETNYIDPIDAYTALKGIYREAVEKAATAALDFYMSTWETPDNPDTFRNHVLSAGPCEAINVLKEWVLLNGVSLDLMLAEHPYLAAEAAEEG